MTNRPDATASFIENFGPTGTSLSSLSSVQQEQSSEQVVTSGPPLKADDVYLSADFGPPALAAARRRLREAISELDGSVAAFRQDDAIEADDHLNKTQIVLAEIIPHMKDAGDGFGIIVTSALCCLLNLAGSTAIEEQAVVLRKVLRRAAEEPYLSSELAAEVTLELEDADLDPDLRGLQALVDSLTDE